MTKHEQNKENIKKRISAMLDQVNDADAQLDFIQILHKFCKDEPTTGVVVQAGGVKLTLSAMDTHLEDLLVQRECTVLLQRLVGRGGTSATKAALAANVLDKLCNAMEQHPRDQTLQGAAASVFRELVAKGGENAAKLIADSDAVKLLSAITSKMDVNVQYQAVKAVAAIHRLAPPEEEYDDFAPPTPSEPEEW
jgi:hypothetical protein